MPRDSGDHDWSQETPEDRVAAMENVLAHIGTGYPIPEVNRHLIGHANQRCEMKQFYEVVIRRTIETTEEAVLVLAANTAGEAVNIAEDGRDGESLIWKPVGIHHNTVEYNYTVKPVDRDE